MRERLVDKQCLVRAHARDHSSPGLARAHTHNHSSPGSVRPHKIGHRSQGFGFCEKATKGDFRRLKQNWQKKNIATLGDLRQFKAT